MAVLLSVNVLDETMNDLTELAERHNGTTADVIRIAVSVYYFVVEEISKGKQLRTIDKDGRISVIALE